MCTCIEGLRGIHFNHEVMTAYALPLRSIVSALSLGSVLLGVLFLQPEPSFPSRQCMSSRLESSSGGYRRFIWSHLPEGETSDLSISPGQASAGLQAYRPFENESEIRSPI